MNLQSHDNLTRKRGEIVLFFKARKCACGTAAKTLERVRDEGGAAQDVGRADYACKTCRGNGVWWADAIKVKALVTDVQQGARQLLHSGEAVPGDLVLIQPPLGWRNIRINDLDKVIFTARGGQTWDGDVLTKAQFAADYDFTTYPIAEVECVSWIDPQHPDDPPIIAVRGTDYDYTIMERKLRWLPGAVNEPAEGVRFSVTYFVYFEWIAWASPFQRVEGNNLLGSKALLKKRHMAGLT